MRDPRIEKLAELIAGYSLDLKEGQVYRIDVGLSQYYGGRAVEVLEIGPGGTKILQAQR